MTGRHTYTVTGMTCEHCVRAVTQELSGLPGVAGVEVDLGTGAVTVTSAAAAPGSADMGVVHGASVGLVGPPSDGAGIGRTDSAPDIGASSGRVATYGALSGSSKTSR